MDLKIIINDVQKFKTITKHQQVVSDYSFFNVGTLLGYILSLVI